MKLKNLLIIASLFGLIVFSVFSCSKSPESEIDDNADFTIYEQKEVEVFTPDTLSVLINDSFAFIFSGDFNEDYLILVDVSMAKCFIYQDTQLVRTVGEKGEGPGEFQFMNSGVVKFVSDSLFAVYDAVSTRIQFFNLEGNLTNTVKLQHFGLDFDILDDYVVLTPMMGDDELVLVSVEDGEIVKKYSATKSVNLQTEMLPPPFRIFEIVNDTILYLMVDDYKIYRYTVEDSIVSGFGVEWEVIPFPEGAEEEMMERAGEYRDLIKDRLREDQFPCWAMFYDKAQKVLWISISTEQRGISRFDLFDDQGNYLKRIEMELGEDLMTLVINDGRLAGFDQATAQVVIFDVSGVYDF
ncbi:MAG: hypothetical protein APR63_06295 [Desulfuromonas sp. SDB]|nr:MAG: hypothetical protein APR63_06295 [Desulfuromonas sp. SDB]